MSSESKPDVFISYNQADKEIASKVAEYLESAKIGERNIRVFFASWDIKPADNFIDKINEGLTKAKFFALVLSPDALKAEWPIAERAASLLSDPSGRVGRVIPILAKPCKVPPLLAIRNRIDLRERSRFKTEMQRMLCVVRGEPLPRGREILESKTVSESGYSTLPMENNASLPDKIDESIHTNLFPVTKLPPAIWSAPTAFWKKSDVYASLGNSIPSFILREKHLHTFSNLNEGTNRLRLAVDPHEIKSINVREWLNHEDKSRWLIDLLFSKIRRFASDVGLYYDRTSKQFYGDKRIITNEKFSWTAHVRKGRRGLIIPYAKKNEETGVKTTYFYRHRAVKLRFQILGSELFLQIDPGWEFSRDGSVLIKGKRRSVLNTKLQSHLKNDVEFDEMRFWAWILSDGMKITVGSKDSSIEIDAKPLSFKTSYGVFGDHKPLPDVIEYPPSLTDEDDSETLTTDEELDSKILITDEELDADVKEVSYRDV